MKITLTIIGLCLVVLTGCTPPKANEHVTSWGTHFVYDDQKVHAITRQLFDCVNTPYPDDATAKEIKDYLIGCDLQYLDRIYISHDPATLYGLTGVVETGDDKYQEFWMCMHLLASPMYDLPIEYSPETFKAKLRGCLNEHPRKPAPIRI